MKTYKKEIESPRLVIRYDAEAESPREWDNLGEWVQISRNYESPDKRFVDIVKETSEEAENATDHVRRIKERIEEEGEKVLFIFPVSMYDHSGVAYHLGEWNGWDYSCNGFYIVLENEETKEMSEEKVKESIKGEISVYNDWAIGSVYMYQLFDENGKSDEWKGGFYSLEEIKEDLPQEWENEDMEDYFKY